MNKTNSRKKTGTKNSRRDKEERKPRPLAVTYTFTVPHSMELLELLLSKIPNSRNSVKSLLSDHKVLVNGHVTTQYNFPLAKDDVVKVARQSVHDLPKASPKVRSHIVNEKRTGFRKMIIYEDDYFLAINKPSGLLSVESDTDRRSAYALAADYMKQKDPASRPFILHRIDQDTSGVLVFAKDIRIHSMLRMHWNEDITRREYYAVVEGVMEKKEDTLTEWLFENRNGLVLVSRNHSGKKAVTHYEVVRENDAYSLLKVTIDTGRKNQIRVMLKNIGHPVVGDEKYGDGKGPLSRLGLHASELDFMSPITHKNLVLKAPIPQEFTSLFGKVQEEKQD